MISPIYQHYMKELVGIVLTKALLVGMSPIDQNQLVLIALVVGQDAVARDRLQEELADHGDLVAEIWRRYCEAVNQHNAAGVVSANLNISEMLQRVIDENRG